MRSTYRQTLVGAAVILLAGGAATALAQKEEARPVGVVKARIFLGEFE